MEKPKTILVTGGAGFIGSHLCEYLIKQGDRVICFDNLSAGRLENIEHIKNKIVFIKGDVNKLTDIEPVFQDNKIDAVFHYAAVVGVKKTLESPLEVLDDVEGTRNILKLALEHGKPKVIFASSSEVYGEPVEIPEIESGHINPKIPYAVVKLYGEKLVEAYWQKYRLPTCSLRFFNVYGPRQESSDYGFVAGIFIKNVLKGKSPVIFGDGTQTRDFIYIDDNVEASFRAFELQKTNGETINVGTGKPTTILDLAETIIEECEMAGKINVKFSPKRDDIRHRFPDVSKMIRLIGFRPKIPLRLGLKKTIDWYREYAKT
jgi:UDP-glucose 4-epimerase